MDAGDDTDDDDDFSPNGCPWDTGLLGSVYCAVEGGLAVLGWNVAQMISFFWILGECNHVSVGSRSWGPHEKSSVPAAFASAGERQSFFVGGTVGTTITEDLVLDLLWWLERTFLRVVVS